ncbi:MerR family transcriptional regulator [Sphingomonas sp.]|uniref:MerR family transcriptional regulator n=1 Tax=Sphingomonas sp. TaxID=28214 RepID=UPI001EBAAA6B|nr:MerR family transcriptional regulator [Sphingomonas sp.]MBX3593689.1 MerR family transcriptional regulator [Sphingomonas sp.]
MASGADRNGSGKKPGALRTIGELAQDIGRPQHILRYWETRFPQLRPLQRAGGRRYYRIEDVALVRRIDALLGREGYTIRGVQRLLDGEGGAGGGGPMPGGALKAVRDALARALAEDKP